MKNILGIIQIIVSALLIILIIMQGRGIGFGRAWGGGGSFSRRGLEKFVFKATFVVASIFILISVLQLLV